MRFGQMLNILKNRERLQRVHLATEGDLNSVVCLEWKCVEHGAVT